MVSKLRLAAQEAFAVAASDEDAKATSKLANCYYDIRAGIGDFKTPENYGAFPMDPYSHTPGAGGARQPGLTGQVKEDILCRFGELGVSVRDKKIHFEPRLLRKEDFLVAGDRFVYLDVLGIERIIRLGPGALAFTYCQVPIVYQRSETPSLAVEFNNRKRFRQEILILDEENSRAIFERSGAIRSIVCGVNPIEASGNK